MRFSRRTALLVHLIWAIGGAAIGATVALLLCRGVTADWVGATGTWFGAVATVLALLWAVQTFRADQANRDHARQVEEEQRRQAAEEEAKDINDQASLVTIALLGGGGYGSDPNMQMNSVRLVVKNNSRETVRVTTAELLPPLKENGWRMREFTIQAMDAIDETVPVTPFEAHSAEFSGAPMSRLEARMTFILDGRTWTTSTNSTPTRA